MPDYSLNYRQRYFQSHRKREGKLNRAYVYRNRDLLAAAQRARTAQLKEEAISAYGGRCTCCGLDDSRFLTFDHVNGDGKEHRARLGGGRGLLYWLKNNDYPPSVQLLCWNCNGAKGVYGECPHKGEVKSIPSAQ